MISSFRTRDLLAGGLAIAFGLFYLIEALSYNLGTATRMGPGYFPFGLGLLMVALGIAIIVFDARSPEQENDEPEAFIPSRRALLFLPASILVFAFVVGRFGLAPATFLAIFLSTFADRSISLLKGFVIALVMTVLCVLIFRVGLGMQVRAFIW